jgi:hypothetical protein
MKRVANCRNIGGTFRREKLLGIAGIAMLFLFGGCSPKMNIYKSAWQGNTITIDGETSDWRMPLQYTDPNTNVHFSVTNDNNNLYICMEANDEAAISGITQKGLQIWIDTTGKKNHQVGISCPVVQNVVHPDNNQRERRNFNSGNGQPPPPLTPDSVKQMRIYQSFLERSRQMHVLGFKTIPDGLVNLPDSNGIQLAVSWDYVDVLVYEAAIPLKSFLKYPLSLSDSNRIIGISFNFTSIPKGSNGNGGGGGVHPSIGIGMGFGMMGMFVGGGGGGGASAPDPEAETIWRPFHLATVPRRVY